MIIPLDAWRDSRRPVHEELGSLRHLALAGDRQRRNLPDPLARHSETLSAGSDHGDIRSTGKDLRDQRGGRAEHMLAIVDDEQQLGGAEVIDYSLDQTGADLLLLTQPEPRRNRRRHHLRITDGCEFHETDAVAKRTSDFRRRLQRKACLSCTSHPGQSHQPVCGDELDNLGQLLFPADKARELNGKVVIYRFESSQRRESAFEPGSRDLEELMGRSQVLHSMLAHVDEVEVVRRTDEKLGRLGDDDLPAMGRIHDSRCRAHGEAEHIFTPPLGLTGM